MFDISYEPFEGDILVVSEQKWHSAKKPSNKKEWMAKDWLSSEHCPVRWVGRKVMLHCSEAGAVIITEGVHFVIEGTPWHRRWVVYQEVQKRFAGQDPLAILQGLEELRDNCVEKGACANSSHLIEASEDVTATHYGFKDRDDWLPLVRDRIALTKFLQVKKIMEDNGACNDG